MRATLRLDAAVAAKARKGAARPGKPFRDVVNQALRLGLEQDLRPPSAKKYVTKPRPLGLRKGMSYDNTAELLAQAEGADYR